MHTFKELTIAFAEKFAHEHFPPHPASLYDPCTYFLSLGGKRIRPIMCLLGNELFAPLENDAYLLGIAVELFHNFTLIHDDIMDEANLRRGMETVHVKYGPHTALLAGDVMLIKAYEYLNQIQPHYLPAILKLFNTTAKEVCEGQQLDMDFQMQDNVKLSDYITMISLKTSVLLAASLEMGAIIGGASEGGRKHLYEFGRNLGIAFQIQDDYLDAYGDPAKFGKEVGGDIRQNKKTFLLIHALEVATPELKADLLDLISNNPEDKVERMLAIYAQCNVATWATALKEQYITTALEHLEAVPISIIRKEPLKELTNYLMDREQ